MDLFQFFCLLVSSSCIQLCFSLSHFLVVRECTLGRGGPFYLFYIYKFLPPENLKSVSLGFGASPLAVFTS